MHYTYILHSAELDRFYIGSTSDLAGRLERHLMNHKGFTSKAKDWEIIYIEEFETKTLAMKRERQIKSWKSANKIRELISKN